MVFILCNKTGFLCTSFSNTEFEAARHHLPSQNCILDAREIVRSKEFPTFRFPSIVNGSPSKK